MSSLANTVYGIAAACSFASGVSPSYTVQRGFDGAVIQRTGVGDYTLTVKDAINWLTEACVTCGLQGSVAGMISVEPLTTTTIRVRTVDAAAAATDINFWLVVTRIAP